MAEASGLLNRRTERFDTNLPVAADISGTRLLCLVKNVSLGGCLMEGTAMARVGEIFAVTFGMPGVWESFRSKIMWAVPKEQEVRRYGCAFWALEDKAKERLLSTLLRVAKAHHNRNMAPSLDPIPGTPLRFPNRASTPPFRQG